MIPHKVDRTRLWDKDVPDNIWDISTLLDETEFHQQGGPPPWLVNLRVQKGIRVEQELSNCRVELRRCEFEARNMRVWLSEQTAAVEHAVQGQSKNGKLFSLLLHA